MLDVYPHSQFYHINPVASYFFLIKCSIFFLKLDKANKPTQIVNIKNRFNIHSQNQFLTFNSHYVSVLSSSFSNESPSQRYWEIFKRLNEGTYTQAVPNLESRWTIPRIKTKHFQYAPPNWISFLQIRLS